MFEVEDEPRERSIGVLLFDRGDVVWPDAVELSARLQD
jgi:hypothetical protein